MCTSLVAYFKDVSSPAAIQSVHDAAVSTQSVHDAAVSTQSVQDAAVSTRGHGHLLFAMCCVDVVLMKSAKIRESGMEKKVS